MKKEHFFIKVNKNEPENIGFLIANINPEIIVIRNDKFTEETYAIDSSKLLPGEFVFKISSEDYNAFFDEQERIPTEESPLTKKYRVREDCPEENSIYPVSLFEVILEEVHQELPEPIDPQDIPLTPREQHALKEAIEFLTIEALRK